MKNIIHLGFGAWLGGMLAVLGYNVYSWQWWAVYAPCVALLFIYGEVCSIETRRKYNI